MQPDPCQPHVDARRRQTVAAERLSVRRRLRHSTNLSVGRDANSVGSGTAVAVGIGGSISAALDREPHCRIGGHCAGFLADERLCRYRGFAAKAMMPRVLCLP